MIHYIHRSVFYSLAVTMCFAMLISISYAVENEAGKVLLTRGKVTAKRVTSEADLQRGSLLFSQDEIHVGANGRTQFRLSDDAVISLQENSVFKIRQYSYQQKGKEDIAFFELLSGGLRTVTGVIGKGDKKAYELKTPLATIGIRGTLFEVEIVGNETYVALREGEVFTQSTISGCSLSLSAGQFLHISSGGCRILGEDELPKNIKLFATGHSSIVKTSDPDDSINLDIIRNEQGDIVPDLDEVSRQGSVIADFEAAEEASAAATAEAATEAAAAAVEPASATTTATTTTTATAPVTSITSPPVGPSSGP